MVDILPHVAELLRPLGFQIEQSYRDTSVTFPLCVLSCPSNTAEVADCKEMFSHITVQIDVYTLDKDDTMSAAKQVDTVMIAGGFRRSVAQPFTEGELERYMLQFNCGVDSSGTKIII